MKITKPLIGSFAVIFCFIGLGQAIPAKPVTNTNGKPQQQQQQPAVINRDLARYAKSAEIRNYMDQTQDPCGNFYSFTCGNYYRINPPNKSPYQSNTFQTISSSLNRKLSQLLRAPTSREFDTETDMKVKRFFESCMKTNYPRNWYHDNMKMIIGEFGQMPALAGNRWREEDFDWLTTVAQISYKYDMRIILGHLIQVDVANNTVNRLSVVMQDIPLESVSIYVDAVHKSFREAHLSVMVKNMKLALGLDDKLAKKTAREIFDFEKRLFVGEYLSGDDENEEDVKEGQGVEEQQQEEEEVTEVVEEEDEEEEDNSSIHLNLTTIDEMQEKYMPHLDIKRLLNISLGYVPNEQVYDLIEDDAENIITTILETRKRIVANYIFYYLIQEFLLPEPKHASDLESMCMRRTKNHFAKVMDNMVYRQDASNHTQQDVHNMWQTIKATFKSVLQSNKLKWMHPDTRKYALEKLQTIRMEINTYENSNFTEEFGPLEISQSDYIANKKSILALRAKQTRAKLHEPPKPYDDPESLSFTPVYITTENLIKVPVSVLQPYFLWSDFYPNALKFGTLGFLMSHELIHGFDEEGRAHDKDGNKHEWWDKASNDYFSNQTECFNQQYTKFKYGGEFLPELDSQSENIADNGGIRLAYDAYKRWYEDAVRSYTNMEGELMPRLNYTSKQLFFIGYGQLWCSATHPALRNYVSSTDDHVPEKFRVIGPLKNLAEFSEEFQCRVGSYMNPEKKCIIY
ncbi:endothelin-converting enzyme 1-like [Musca autumnalis]|uniref:endothelin-converting enzyme 1-like n=1 Tax=Musca autumnalis TaxID=221902 RepID=UPI003CF88378